MLIVIFSYPSFLCARPNAKLRKYTGSTHDTNTCIWIVIPKAFKSRFVYSLRFLCFNKSGASKINVNAIKGPCLLFLVLLGITSPPLSFVIGCLFSSCAFHELQSTPLHESIAVDSIARLREASKGALLVGRVDGLRCVLFDPLQESSDWIGSDRDRIQLELKASLI